MYIVSGSSILQNMFNAKKFLLKFMTKIFRIYRVSIYTVWRFGCTIPEVYNLCFSQRVSMKLNPIFYMYISAQWLLLYARNLWRHLKVSITHKQNMIWSWNLHQIDFSRRVAEGSRSAWLQTLGNQLINHHPYIRYTNSSYWLYSDSWIRYWASSERVST